MFQFTELAFGEYRLSADKQEDGYLSTEPDIYSDRESMTIVVAPETPEPTTTIQLGPKAAAITGSVTDVATNKAISAHLSLAPASGKGWSTQGTNGRFRLLVPADLPVTFGACAEGYKIWHYPGPLHLTSESQQAVDVKLERTTGVSPSCDAGTY